MIEVVFSPKAAFLSVKGHAPTEPDRDYSLVCAAATQTLRLFEHAISSFSAHDALAVTRSEISRGSAVIEYRPTLNYSANVALGLIADGFRMLAANHPEQISYKITDESEVKNR